MKNLVKLRENIFLVSYWGMTNMGEKGVYISRCVTVRETWIVKVQVGSPETEGTEGRVETGKYLVRGKCKFGRINL
jgi:hypothetical protein